MAILKIARMGHPALRWPTEPVSDPTAPEIRRLVADMIETMYDAPGIGLAATQVHVPKRVVVFYVPERRADGAAGTAGGAQPLTVLINPVIEPLGEETDSMLEACLSVPGFTGLVPRFRRVRYTGIGLEGEPIDRVAEGFHARVVQHECDHLDGILYPMRIVDMSTFGFAEEVHREHAAAASEIEAE
ncbi:MAG: peptide deformylase [Rhodospirillales bacterium]|nr:peptide deformylase [Rhodospirillales bacterium]